MYLAAIIVIGTLVAMTSGRMPPLLALMTGLAIAGLTGVSEPSDLFAGLSNGGVITVACMLVIAKGIVQTGFVNRITWALLSSVETSRQALSRLIFPVGIASSLMNTTPIVAILVPAAKELEQTRRIPARSVLLPIAHVTTLAGSITLIGTSSNLLIAGIAHEYGINVSMLSFAPVALPVALVGWLVIFLLSPHMLAGENESGPIRTKIWRVEVPIGEQAIARGRVPEDLGIATTQEYDLQAIVRNNDTLPPSQPIAAEDVLVFNATPEGISALWKSPLFGLAPRRLYQVVLSSVGEGTLADLEQNSNVHVVASQTSNALQDTPMVPGETCFATCESTQEFDENRNVALWQDFIGRSPQPGKTWVALAILVVVIVAASVGLAPVELASFAGAIALVLTKVLTPRSAVRALDWNVLGILAGSVGLGSIVVTSGLADEIGRGIRFLANGNLVLMVIVVVVGTAIMTNLVTNAATAAMLTPIGISIATEYGIDPVLLLAVIGTCISLTFINPFSHQSNMMVMGPGGYTTRSFVRFGIPIILVAMITTAIVSTLLLSS